MEYKERKLRRYLIEIEITVVKTIRISKALFGTQESNVKVWELVTMSCGFHGLEMFHVCIPRITQHRA